MKIGRKSRIFGDIDQLGVADPGNDSVALLTMS